MASRLPILLAFVACLSQAQVVPPDRYDALRWRCIGPHRGGRTVGATGIPGKANELLIGVNNGGVWKTTDFGRTWKPIFDDQPTGSIGNLAVAPSNPDVIYVGSGEGLQRPDLSVGDGVYKSVDGGKTWTHLGLRDAQQINTIIVDPKNPNRLFVAALGHPYGPNSERGVFRSLDGGKTFKKVLPSDPHPPAPSPSGAQTIAARGGGDADTGAIALAFDPRNSRTVYASLWAARQGPWENGTWVGTTSGLFKSTDGGDTWKPLTKGLPPSVGRIGFDVSRSNPKVIYATVQAITPRPASVQTLGQPAEALGQVAEDLRTPFKDLNRPWESLPRVELSMSRAWDDEPGAFGQRAPGSGVYRSEDGGETWTFMNEESRIIGRGDDFAEIRVHPKNPDVVFACNTSMYRSDDRGKTWTCIKGAPGGDDYHTLWINPDQPDIMLFAADQGAGVTVNGGETWSSWYNQPTAQFYHVSTDDDFPYNVYGGQQESGSAMVASRGRNGQITFREWNPVGAEEYGYVAADPMNSRYVYGGKLTKFDRLTGKVQSVRPKQAARYLRTAPVLFSTVDKRALYFAGNILFKSVDGARTWEAISPDLSREDAPSPEGSVFEKPGRRGVIYAVAPSHVKADTIWAGTDDGLIHLTRDGGKTWTNVTPPELTPWSKVSMIDAGHFDEGTAYAAINRIRLDDMTPWIFVTHDFGRTWKKIVGGLPNDPINTVREDPQVPCLLYCGSERAVYFSKDDGASWNPLRLNMPATSIRDLVVKDNDLVVGTHGRSFWILDDIAPLRQDLLGSRPTLFAPSAAYLVDWSINTDTPLPPEEPAGQNPPDGALIYYWLPSPARTVRLEVLDLSGQIVFSQDQSQTPSPPDPKELTVMPGWARPPQAVGTSPGSHRFVWDMRRVTASGRRGLGMNAIWNDTAVQPRGEFLAPGEYRIRLTVDGVSQDNSLTLKADPRN